MNTEPDPRLVSSPPPAEDRIDAPRRRRKRRKRWGRILVTLLVLGSIGGCIQWMVAAHNKPLEEPLKEPVALERDAIEERLLETGTVELRTTVEVKSKMSGKVKTLLVDVGDSVTKNQVLAVIEPDPNEILRLYQKRAAVEARLIELQENTREHERSTQLHEKGVLPGDQFETIRDQVKAAETLYQLALLELQALEREINPGELHEGLQAEAPDGGNAPAALSSLTDIRVLSPMAGLVIKRPAEEGELVISGTATTIAGTTLLELGDPADVLIRASINEVDIGRIRVDQEVEVTLSAYDEEHVPARVQRISPIGITPQGQSVVSFSVEVGLEVRDPRVLPGMTCDLDIVLDRREETLCLPNHALFQEEEKDEEETWKPPNPDPAKPTPPAARTTPSDEEPTYLDYVWVKNGDDWEKREVEVGLKGSRKAEILGGVEEADLVYPDAEHMRWYIDERARRAKKGFLFFKKDREKSGKDAQKADSEAS